MDDACLELYEKESEKYCNEIARLYDEYEAILSEEINSDLSGVDYAFAIMVGVFGALITNNKQLEIVLDEIHQIASTPVKRNDTYFSKITKMLLGHYQTNIDTLPNGPEGRRVFPTRLPNGKRSGPHRIFWGHDILSCKEDNPFTLMIKQTGSRGEGILAAVKHLTADTFSKQGLPIPTSSWWDYSYEDRKKVGNNLLDFCNKLYDESKCNIGKTGGNNDIFNHMFSIHIQDVTVQTVGSVLCKKYLNYRKIKDSVVRHQFLLIAYAIMFYLNCFLGFARTGIVYINWCTLICLIKEFILMHSSSWWDVRKLEKMTTQALKQSDSVERDVRLQLESCQKYSQIPLEKKIYEYIQEGEG